MQPCLSELPFARQQLANIFGGMRSNMFLFLSLVECFIEWSTEKESITDLMYGCLHAEGSKTDARQSSNHWMEQE
jgi:hypothetical protein